jgi:hypothetical protein
MKELEIKAMLADPTVPEAYKLGGRLDDRFLDGVEYAERAYEKIDNGWHSVKDGLPPKDIKVLVYTSCGHIAISTYYGERSWGNRWSVGRRYSGVITHWHHLPQLPKKEELEQ